MDDSSPAAVLWWNSLEEENLKTSLDAPTTPANSDSGRTAVGSPWPSPEHNSHDRDISSPTTTPESDSNTKTITRARNDSSSIYVRSAFALHGAPNSDEPGEPDGPKAESTTTMSIDHETSPPPPPPPPVPEDSNPPSGPIPAIQDKEMAVLRERALKDKKWKEEIEATRLNFLYWAGGDTYESILIRRFALIFARIIRVWQLLAGDKNPGRHAVDFGNGRTLTLLQVFQLLPENFQPVIKSSDPLRTSDGGIFSWLNENVMDAIVKLYHPEETGPIKFGRGLASDVNESMDVLFQGLGKRCYLDHQIQCMETNQPRVDWDPDCIYSFPPETEKIVYFFNYTEAHWTVLSMELLPDNRMKHIWYDSMSGGKKCEIYNRASIYIKKLETLIRGQSQLPQAQTFHKLLARNCPQQDNMYDCGVISVYNVLRILRADLDNNDVVYGNIDSNELRYRYAEKILEKLWEIVSETTNEVNVSEVNANEGSQESVNEQNGESDDRNSYKGPSDDEGSDYSELSSIDMDMFAPDSPTASNPDIDTEMYEVESPISDSSDSDASTANLTLGEDLSSIEVAEDDVFMPVVYGGKQDQSIPIDPALLDQGNNLAIDEIEGFRTFASLGSHDEGIKDLMTSDNDAKVDWDALLALIQEGEVIRKSIFGDEAENGVCDVVSGKEV